MESLILLRYFLLVSIPIGLLALWMAYWRRPNTAQALGLLAILLGVMPILGIGFRLVFLQGPGILLFAASPIVMGGVALASANFYKNRPPLKGKFQISVPAVLYFTLIVGCVGGFVKLSEKLRYFDRDLCLTHYRRIPGIENVVVIGSDHSSGFQVSAVQFSLAGRPQTRVRLRTDVQRFNGRYGSHVELFPEKPEIQQVGKWIPGGILHAKAYVNGKFVGTIPEDFVGLQLTASHPFYDIIPLDLKQVSDIVKHYDELEAAFEKLPRRESPGSHTGEHGFTFEYWVTDDESVLPRK